MHLRLSLAFLFLIFAYVQCDECEDDSKPKPASLRLKKKLLCNYDKEVRPVKDKDKYLSVSIRILPRYIEYNTYGTQSLTINSWIGLQWNDEYLKWSPEENEGVQTLHMSIGDIWAPEIKLNNGVSDSTLMSEADCIVRPTGLVMCVAFTEHDSLCKAELSNWPYDSQLCQVEYSTHLLKGGKLSLDISKSNAIIMEGYTASSEWELLNITVAKGSISIANETFSILTYYYSIRRHAADDTVIIVIPALVITALTLAVLWLPPGETERFSLALINIFIQMFSLEQISWVVPKNGDAVPKILLFWRDSLMLCVIVLLETVIVKSILSSRRRPGNWVITITRLFNTGIVQKILILDDIDIEIPKDEEQIGDSTESQLKIYKKDDDKFLVAVTIDRLTFVASFIAYSVMVFKFLT